MRAQTVYYPLNQIIWECQECDASEKYYLELNIYDDAEVGVAKFRGEIEVGRHLVFRLIYLRRNGLGKKYLLD